MKIRKGQQKYKEALAPLWNHQCALCGIDLPAMLRASHSKPWKDSTNEERLVVFNGLLLCCNLDALYEKAILAFDGTGLNKFKLKVIGRIQTVVTNLLFDLNNF